MKRNLTPIASAVALLVLSAAMPAMSAYAQQTTDGNVAPTSTIAQGSTPDQTTPATKAAVNDQQPEKGIQTVEVSGIRASLQKSLDQKRNASSLVEVVTAEDVGKLPDKNVADAIQRLPGVNTSSAATGEGGFDENDRVSIRGTSPSLTQTTINGHAVGTGDWFILSQEGSVGRSVSYSLLPSEIVSSVVVHKGSQADLAEGGVAGTVDIITRKPLDEKQQLTAEASVGAAYSDLADKTKPQFSALVNWKNDANTFGMLFQAFSEERSSRRDGQEMLGYTTIDGTMAAGKAHPDLVGVAVPTSINQAYFTQDRKRDGGVLNFELKPTRDLTLDLEGFYSKMDATNTNISFLGWPGHAIANGAIPSSYTVKNGTLVGATFPTNTTTPMALVDSIYRPGEGEKTNYINLDGKYRATDALTISGQIGYTKGEGYTPSQPAYESDINDIGLTYQMHGIGAPASLSFPGYNVKYNPAQASTGWAWDNNLIVDDTESYGKLDANLNIENAGPLDAIKFGVRFNEHQRVSHWEGYGCNAGCSDGSLATYTGATYPGNFGNNLGGGGFPTNGFYFSQPQVQAYNNVNVNFDATQRHNWPGELNVKEDDTAGYLMGDLQGDHWSGNVGVRLVRTDQTSIVNVLGGSNPIVGSLFGPYTPTSINHVYNDVLPSLNLKYDLNKDLVLRGSLARVMSRADYSALGGSVTLNDPTLSGDGGNPNLKPILSNNFDTSLEWYFAPKSLVSIGFFNMDFNSAVSYGVNSGLYYDQQTQTMQTYEITSPTNVKAINRGVELSYQAPVWGGFGILANYTYADGREKDGNPMVGNSENTFNVQGYYEQGPLSARLAYTYRSDFLVGLDRSFAENEAAVGTVAASINYKINDHLTLNFDALNLNNPTLKYYAENKDQPRAFYTNGRQFYLTLRAKM